MIDLINPNAISVLQPLSLSLRPSLIVHSFLPASQIHRAIFSLLFLLTENEYSPTTMLGILVLLCAGCWVLFSAGGWVVLQWLLGLSLSFNLLHYADDLGVVSQTQQVKPPPLPFTIRLFPMLLQGLPDR